MATNAAGEQILRILSEQHELIRKVAELSLVQARVLEENETEQLVAVLEQRSVLLNRAISISACVDESLASLPESDPCRADILRQKKLIADLANLISRTDREHSIRMVERRDELARQLAGMTTSRAAARAYGGDRGPVGPDYQDRVA
ncbi:MAG: hypothetical protein U0573_10090 [Phycisphaerales bacterium]|nr:hypothetical protein [Planctomycetota bacterium]